MRCLRCLGWSTQTRWCHAGLGNLGSNAHPETSCRDLSARLPLISTLKLDYADTYCDCNVEYHSALFRNRDLPLPNPHFIALHAGISRILYMSGASEVFAQILDKYDRAAGGSVRSPEKRMEIRCINYLR
ncbi:hypothetical protein EDB19DRAFT_1767288 [Suillus lakei]|nr:hypothetical protein EDB19DRAFT_1767288 [Suillus lakei]